MCKNATIQSSPKPVAVVSPVKRSPETQKNPSIRENENTNTNLNIIPEVVNGNDDIISDITDTNRSPEIQVNLVIPENENIYANLNSTSEVVMTNNDINEVFNETYTNAIPQRLRNRKKLNMKCNENVDEVIEEDPYADSGSSYAPSEVSATDCDESDSDLHMDFDKHLKVNKQTTTVDSSVSHVLKDKNHNINTQDMDSKNTKN
ncbi:hypothetical protein NQ314_005187 [Rhamnusium bicolor]|uniref:Uncharacterized protein n=1 Tax=Rhamnusium bicolor TaxID=1586634 RepID=A0AAV8ZH77_9CUCU|nr:hypothetical protein NQ314_005187 [Rhamnusium bicolor]